MQVLMQIPMQVQVSVKIQMEIVNLRKACTFFNFVHIFADNYWYLCLLKKNSWKWTIWSGFTGIMLMIFLWWDKGPHIPRIWTSFHCFRFSCTPEKVTGALDVCFAVFLGEKEHKNETRRAVVEKFILIFLMNTTSYILKQFFCAHIKGIMEILANKLVKVRVR